MAYHRCEATIKLTERRLPQLRLRYRDRRRLAFVRLVRGDRERGALDWRRLPDPNSRRPAWRVCRPAGGGTFYSALWNIPIEPPCNAATGKTFLHAQNSLREAS